MKAIKFLNYIAVLLILSLSSCKDETFDFNEVEEGLPAEVTLKIKTEGNTVVSRAALDEKIENMVDNIYLFIFDSSGNIHDRKFYPASDLHYGTTTSEGTITLNTASLNGARIIGMANITTESSASIYDITEEELDAITSFSQLEEKMVKMHSNSIERAGVFLMSGYVKYGNSTVINIPGDSSNYNLILSRLDAKVMFDITVDPKSGFSDFSFQPKTWVVKKIPSQSMLMEKETGDYNESDANYFSSSVLPFEKINRDVTGSLYTGGSFVFYMPENRKQCLKEITDYSMREEWSEKTDDDRVFVNADPNSTYVEITGLLSYKFFDTEESKEKEVSADVRFIVHLGYGTGDVNDYNTNRNTLYTYNIKVRGIDEIVVEVDSNEGDPDNRPGYEGDVIYNESGSYVFDSHYDRRLIFMNPANITDASEIRWSVSTYFSRGVHTVIDGKEEIEESMRDYRWIKFAINKLHAHWDDPSKTYGHNEYVKYPGDQEYIQDFSPTEQTQEMDLPKLLDVKQLVAYLKISKERGDINDLIPENSTDGHICITAFIDENVYVEDPRIPNAAKDLTLWKKTVDQPDREMHIISQGKSYSADGNSSVTRSLYTFRQKSIRTIYNKDAVNTAWGLEATMETERLRVGSIPSTANDPDNGRANTLKWLGNGDLRWTDVLNTSSRYELNSNYNNALYACVLRNRDLNGNNIIDPEEIRWYLASINQLTDMYIGEYALDINSRLYPWEPKNGNFPPSNKVNWHYTSSTYHVENGQGVPFVLWAEEGASKGNYNSSSSDSNNGPLYAYRCIRNLGIDITDIAEKPADFITNISEGDTYYEFDLSGLNPKALRSYSVSGAGIYPIHDEKSGDNLPWKKFRVSKYLYVAPEWNRNNKHEWLYFQTTNPCSGDNYRVPNMRELMIFTSRKGSELKTYWEDEYNGLWSWLPSEYHICSYTKFSMNGFPPYGNDRNGYSYNPKDGSMGPANNSGYTCGVSDVIN